MSNSFSYTLSQFKLDATTFCNMKSNYFYYIIQNHYQKGLDEKLLNTVSWQRMCRVILRMRVAMLGSLCAKILAFLLNICITIVV